MSVEELPNYENAVRLAREARGIRTATGIGTRSTAGWKIESALEPHRASPQRLSGARRRAVLGLCVLLLAVFFVTRVHVHAHHASLVAAADVPAARIREVDDMRMANLAAIGALTVASGVFAGDKIPDGWVVIADIGTQFSNTQGRDGWAYLFDRGEGTTVSAMPYFTTSAENATGWSTAPEIGSSGSFCNITRNPDGNLAMHPNSPSNCSQTGPGLQRPILRWVNSTPSTVRVLVKAEWYATTGHDARIRLSSDGSILLDRTLLETRGVPIQSSFDLPMMQVLELIEDPTADGCNSDGMKFDLVILAPDCNGNSIADAVEIANGSEFDSNGDGILDSCQCPGDVVENGIVDGADLAALLSVWGTDGGIYPRADTNSDGFVDAQDLAAVLSGWGACP